jgi:hypothetical protein
MQNIPRELASPFRSAGRIHKSLVVVFIVVNSIVFVNACLHEPTVGYDVGEHLKYVMTLGEMRLPTVTETAEFYSPPLPYALPALLVVSGAKDWWWPAKAGQLFNVLLSLGLTFYLLKLCDFFDPGNSHLKTTTLLFLGLLPMYYKSFAFLRGEPFVAFFAVFIIYQVLRVFVRERWSWANTIVLGVALGLIVLSRQWGLLLFPPLILWIAWLCWKDASARLRFIKILLLVMTIAVLTGGWFYWRLPNHRGAVTNFNRPPAANFSFSNQPAGFYFGAGNRRLFTDPLRPAFPNQLMPLLYTEVWGDYWQYFAVSGLDSRTGRFISGGELEELTAQKQAPPWLITDRFQISSYLGRVNMIGLLPSVLGLAAICFGMGRGLRGIRPSENSEATKGLVLVMLYLATSLAGYMWFLIMYPNPEKGDTIKATYLLQIFPFIGLLVGTLLQVVRDKKKQVYQTLVLFLIIVWVHNLPAMLTHYTSWPALQNLLLR